MSTTPKADPAKCDVPGCAHDAASCSDGTEVDAQGLGRPAVPHLNVCTNHHNWPHSEDARAFELGGIYKARLARMKA